MSLSTTFLRPLVLAGQLACVKPIIQPASPSKPNSTSLTGATKVNHEERLFDSDEFHNQIMLHTFRAEKQGLQPDGSSVIRCENFAKTDRKIEDLAEKTADELRRAMPARDPQNDEIDFEQLEDGDNNCVRAQLLPARP